jgi:hypothetical protein
MRLRRLSCLTAITAALLLLSPPVSAIAEDRGDGEVVSSPTRGTYEGRVRVSGHHERQAGHSGESTHARRRVKQLVRRVDSRVLAVATTVMCREARDAFISCAAAPKSGKSVKRAQVRRDLDGIARLLVARIRLPDPRPLVGPDPAVNEWKMVAVGYPLWLWTAGPGVVTDRVRAFGVSFILRARWVSTRFEMGDGHTVLCSRMRPYRSGVRPGGRSPDCGYVYGRASLPGGSFTVRATTSWRVSWSALGMSGSVPASFSGSRVLPVGELNALVVR